MVMFSPNSVCTSIAHRSQFIKWVYNDIGKEYWLDKYNSGTQNLVQIQIGPLVSK